jgi:tetratricopeptide (TPR) repeat protein
MPEDHLKRFDLLAGRAAVYDVLAEREKQLVDVEAMLALAEKEGDETRQVDALLALAQFYHKTESDKVREPGNKALQIARGLDDKAREGRILWVMGENELVNVNNSEALKYLSESADFLEEAGLTRELIECLTSTSIILGRIGRTAEALEMAQKTVEMSIEAGDKQLEALSTRRLAIAYYAQSRYAEALTIAEASLALFREIGDITGELHARNVVGINKERLGRFEEAENDYLELLKTAETIGHDTGIQFMVTNLAELYFWSMGDPEKSLELIHDYLEGYQGENEYLIMTLTGWKAYVLYCLGRLKEAYELSRSILQKYKNILDQENVMLWESFMGFLSAEMGDFKLSHQHIEEVIGWYSQNEGAFDIIVHNIAQAAVVENERSFLHEGLGTTKKAIRYAEEHHLTPSLGVALYLEACLHLALLDDDSSHAEAALDCTEGALTALKVEPTIIRPGQYLFIHSRALRINGHEAQADDYLKQAYEHMEMVVGNIKDKDLKRSYLENVRDNRGIQAAYQERFGA